VDRARLVPRPFRDYPVTAEARVTSPFSRLLRCRHFQRLIHFVAVQSYLRPRSHRLLRRLSAVLGAPCSARHSPVLRSLSLAMASALFTPEQNEIILRNPITQIIDTHRDRLPNDLSSFDQDIDIDEGT
jgi:hypothetical protein